MTDFRHRRRLRKLQKKRDAIDRRGQAELRSATGEKYHKLQSEWSYEFGVIQEEIDEYQSDHVRQLAEKLDVSLPKREEGEYWERMQYTSERLILTTRGREETRAKIRGEQKHMREAWGFYLGFVATIGSILIALLTIYIRR